MFIQPNVLKRFTIYSVLGWLLEGMHHLCTEGHFIKPNFLHGPYKPMYGFVAVFLLAMKEWGAKAYFLATLVIPSAIEYVSAAWLKRSFGLRYWDYSTQVANLHGHVCLKFSFYWVILAYGLSTIIQPKLSALAKRQPKWGSGVLLTLSGILLVDIGYTLFSRYRKG